MQIADYSNLANKEFNANFNLLSCQNNKEKKERDK